MLSMLFLHDTGDDTGTIQARYWHDTGVCRARVGRCLAFVWHVRAIFWHGRALSGSHARRRCRTRRYIHARGRCMSVPWCAACARAHGVCAWSARRGGRRRACGECCCAAPKSSRHRDAGLGRAGWDSNAALWVVCVCGAVRYLVETADWALPTAERRRQHARPHRRRRARTRRSPHPSSPPAF